MRCTSLLILRAIKKVGNRGLFLLTIPQNWPPRKHWETTPFAMAIGLFGINGMRRAPSL
jgi:hypothetical protein